MVNSNTRRPRILFKASVELIFLQESCHDQ
jgi:hypothetical protein